LGSGTWRFENNLFDGTLLTQYYTNNVTTLANAYLGTPSMLVPTNALDQVLATFSFTNGPLGEYYQLSTNLYSAGSTNASNLGLYHHTVRPDQSPEGTNRVAIGFHYVAQDSTDLPNDAYLASEGFSTSTQGASGWSYRYTTNLAGLPGPALAGYNAGMSSWAQVPGDTYCLVGADWQHPGWGHDSVRSFQLPASGSVTVWSQAYHGSSVCSTDPIRVRVLHNDTELVTWTEVATNRTAGNPVTLDVASPITVAAGDWIHFQVNKATNDLCDVVYWNPSIAYMTIRRIGDADNDGLADWVEDRNGNGVRDTGETDWLDPDTDHDGRSDRQEAIDGTDPLDPNSVKRVRLAWWRFDNTNWVGQAGQQPLVARNLARNQCGNYGFGVVLAGTNASQPELLSYRAIETGATPALASHAGSIRFMYCPHWFSRLPSSDTNYYAYSGDGPGQAVRLIEMGDAAEQQTPGYFSVDIDPDGTNLFIRSRYGTGTVTTNLTLPIRVLSLLTNTPNEPRDLEFFEVLVGWSVTNTYAHFLGPTVGSYSTSGLTNAYPPNSSFLAGGLRIGTDAAAAYPARGEIMDVETFNWQGLIATNSYRLAVTSTIEPPSLTLTWPVPAGSISYAKRRTAGSANWGPTFAVCGDQYVDTGG
jgi:hypothetical protein